MFWAQRHCLQHRLPGRKSSSGWDALCCRARPKQGQSERVCPGCWERLLRGCREPSEDLTGLWGARGTQYIYPRAHLPVLATSMTSTCTVQCLQELASFKLFTTVQIYSLMLLWRAGLQGRRQKLEEGAKEEVLVFFLTFKKSSSVLPGVLG